MIKPEDGFGGKLSVRSVGEIHLSSGWELRGMGQLSNEGDSGNIHVPAGTEIAISVSTRARPRAGMTILRALYRSWPAAKALPFVGALALSERN